MLSTAALAAGIAGAGWFVTGGGIQAERIASGRAIYAEHCASCHGRDLDGQPDWQTRLPNGRMPAPPHDASGHTWHHSDDQLFTIVKKGVSAIVPDYESDMPGFEGVLSEVEIRAVLEFIKSTWPEREREFQARRSRAEN
jgi:mono/diheme cytochrome c family protein